MHGSKLRYPHMKHLVFEQNAKFIFGLFTGICSNVIANGISNSNDQTTYVIYRDLYFWILFGIIIIAFIYNCFFSTSKFNLTFSKPSEKERIKGSLVMLAEAVPGLESEASCDLHNKKLAAMNSVLDIYERVDHMPEGR